MSGPWAPLNEWEGLDFWEVCEDRYQTRSTILTSHQPVPRSHAQIVDPTEADRILDRLVDNAHRIEGELNEEESMPSNRRGGARGPLLSGERDVSRSLYPRLGCCG